MSKLKKIGICGFLFFTSLSCKNEPNPYENYDWKKIQVKVTAYNSVPWQTDLTPNITAFGDTLKPNMKCIAVSRDLLSIGLKHKTPVKIEGLDSIYFVLDKMHSRKRKQIDIYMGTDIKAAKNWGVKNLYIEYGVPRE